MDERARILVVDDDELVLRVLADTLSPHFEVETALSGNAALELLERGEFSVLLADQRMPGLTGVQLASRARTMRPHLVTILLSGYTDPADMVAAINEGQVFRFIRKPWEPADLVLTLQNAVERYRLSRDNARLLIELNRRMRAVQILYDVFGESVLSPSRHPADLLLDRLDEVVPYDLAAVLIAEGEDANLRLRTRGVVGAANATELRDQTLELLAFSGGQPVDEATLRTSALGDLEPDLPLRRIDSQLLVPLRRDQRVVGVMVVQAFAADAYAADATRLVDLLANGTAEAASRLRLAAGRQWQRLEQALAVVPEGVLVADASGSVQMANATARRLLQPLGGVASGLLESIAARPEALPIHPAPPFKRELTAGERTLRVDAARVVMEGGELAVLVIVHDVTEAGQADAQRHEFFATLSHEIRTPLTSLTATLDLLLNDTAGPLNAKQRDYIELAEQACTSLNRLVDSVLDLEKSTHGTIDIRVRRFRADSLVREVVARHQALARERELQLKVEASGNLPALEADPVRVEQVVSNLLVNAAKFAPSKSEVKVTLDVSSRVGGWLVLGVHNSGAPVDPAELAAIFERYRQGKRRTNSLGLRGTGLGLAICRAIVEAHGGSVLAESDEVSTRFWAALPLQPCPVPAVRGRAMVWIDCGESDIERVAMAAELALCGLHTMLLPRRPEQAAAARQAIGEGLVVSSTPGSTLVPGVQAVLNGPALRELGTALARLEALGNAAAVGLDPKLSSIVRGLGGPVPVTVPPTVVEGASLVELAEQLAPRAQAQRPVRAFLDEARQAGAEALGWVELLHVDVLRAAYGPRHSLLVVQALCDEVDRAIAGDSAWRRLMLPAGALLAGPRPAVTELLETLTRRFPALARLNYRKPDRERGAVDAGGRSAPLVDVRTRMWSASVDVVEVLAALGLT